MPTRSGRVRHLLPPYVFEIWPKRLPGLADAATVAVAIAKGYGAVATFDQKLIKRMKVLGVDSYW